jgi:hypothetical protein
MPDGYHADNVMDIALGRLNGSQVAFTFYDDGGISAGTTADLGSVRGPTRYAFEGQRSPENLVGFAINGETAYFFYRSYRQIRDPKFIGRWQELMLRKIGPDDLPLTKVPMRLP